MVNKKAVLIATIIAILIFGGIFGARVYFSNKIDNNDIESEIGSVSKTVSSSENSVKKEENTIKENKIEEINSINTVNENTTADKKETNNSKEKDKETPEKTAINLVKEKFGSDITNVYFSIDDNIADGIYIVSVRNKDTTTELESYKVDIMNKTVTEN